jgi:hypothetical protein
MVSCEALNPQALHRFSQWTVDPGDGTFVVPVHFSPQRSVYDVTRQPTPYPSSLPSPRLEVIEDDFFFLPEAPTVDRPTTPVSSSLEDGYEFEIEAVNSSAGAFEAVGDINTFPSDLVDIPSPDPVIESALVQDVEMDSSEGEEYRASMLEETSTDFEEITRLAPTRMRTKILHQHPFPG